MSIIEKNMKTAPNNSQRFGFFKDSPWSCEQRKDGRFSHAWITSVTTWNLRGSHVTGRSSWVDAGSVDCWFQTWLLRPATASCQLVSSFSCRFIKAKSWKRTDHFACVFFFSAGSLGLFWGKVFVSALIMNQRHPDWFPKSRSPKPWKRSRLWVQRRWL